jgi:hypothetical protein
MSAERALGAVDVSVLCTAERRARLQPWPFTAATVHGLLGLRAEAHRSFSLLIPLRCFTLTDFELIGTTLLITALLRVLMSLALTASRQSL